MTLPIPIRATTILARTPTQLISYLSNNFLQTNPNYDHYKSQTCLFSLSTNIPPHDLQTATTVLGSMGRSTVGWLSAPPVDSQSTSSSSSSSSASSAESEKSKGSQDKSPHISLSLAFFPPSSVVPFRSEIAGKPPIQVGRWHAMRDDAELETIGDAQGMYDRLEREHKSGEEVKIDWEEVWARNVRGNVLPVELEMVGKDRIASVVFASDNASEGLSSALATLPDAQVLGQVATATPFITGRPVTMFHDGKVYDKGAVGLAFLKDTDSSETPSTMESTLEMSFPSLKPVTLGTGYEITRAEGNLVLTLDGQNPTQLLLKDIKKSGGGLSSDWPFKDELVYYLAVVEDPGDTIKRVYEISSGDPSRGSLALKSDKAAPSGSKVKFYQSPTSLTGPSTSPSTVSTLPAPSKSPSINFVVSPEQTSSPSTIGMGEIGSEGDEVTVLENTFVSCSEGGVIVGETRSGELAWRCTAPGSVVRLRC